MADIRIPRGYGKVSYPFQILFDRGITPSYNLRAAKFLPTWSVEAAHDDPIVIPPGTFLGRLNDTDHSAVASAYRTTGPLVPACPLTYTITYGALDLVNALGEGWLGTPDIDQTDGLTVRSAAGDATQTLAAVRPLGIAAQPIMAGWFADKYYNYERQLPVTWISHDFIVRIPCMTSGEAAVKVGQLVKLDDTAAPKWAGNSGTLGTPGRIHGFDGGSYSADQEYVVGRCVNKVFLAKQASASTGQLLSTAIGTSAPRTLTNISVAAANVWPYAQIGGIDSKTETVPGLGLGGSSATMGLSAEMLWAKADSSGYFYALDILLRV